MSVIVHKKLISLALHYQHYILRFRPIMSWGAIYNWKIFLRLFRADWQIFHHTLWALNGLRVLHRRQKPGLFDASNHHLALHLPIVGIFRYIACHHRLNEDMLSDLYLGIIFPQVDPDNNHKTQYRLGLPVGTNPHCLCANRKKWMEHARSLWACWLTLWKQWTCDILWSDVGKSNVYQGITVFLCFFLVVSTCVCEWHWSCYSTLSHFKPRLVSVLSHC